MEYTSAHKDSFPVEIVGGPLEGVYNRKYVMENFHNGRYTQDYSGVRGKGFICQRKELDKQPKINGYLGPMWNGNSLRYETASVYNALSC